ncbi:MAG: hypothetical protein LBJ08_12515 [Bifidobacteriaceae bacterium]|jgi:hypothetical protein|nr:hypothetical protein [Bifidobacteriaceae bacterium]
MTGAHLGWRASALSDGELSSIELARAWAHYRTCGWCREQVDGQREIRAEMGKLSGPHIPPDVLIGLYATPRGAAQPASVHDRRAAGSADRRPHGRPERIRRARTVQVALVSTAAIVIGGLTSAYALGDAALPAPQVVAAARESAVLNASREAANSRHPAEHAYEETQAALRWMATAGWSVPETLPDGFHFTSYDYSTFEEASVSVVVATPTGSISLTLLHARIDPGYPGDLEARTIGGRTVYCQEVDGQLAGAMNSGGELLAFVSNTTEQDLATILANSPGPAKVTPSTRIARGLDSLWKRLS